MTCERSAKLRRTEGFEFLQHFLAVHAAPAGSCFVVPVPDGDFAASEHLLESRHTHRGATPQGTKCP
jgi:hypothetical protein